MVRISYSIPRRRRWDGSQNLPWRQSNPHAFQRNHLQWRPVCSYHRTSNPWFSHELRTAISLLQMAGWLSAAAQQGQRIPFRVVAQPLSRKHSADNIISWKPMIWLSILMKTIIQHPTLSSHSKSELKTRVEGYPRQQHFQLWLSVPLSGRQSLKLCSHKQWRRTAGQLPPAVVEMSIWRAVPASAGGWVFTAAPMFRVNGRRGPRWLRTSPDVLWRCKNLDRRHPTGLSGK